MQSLLIRRLPKPRFSTFSPFSTTITTTSPQHYTSILNLTQTSTLSDVKANFRELAKRHHPDANNPNSSPDAFQSILDAYQEALEEYDDYNGFTPTSGKLAVAAEVFTVEEMEGMDGYDVHVVRVALEEAAALPGGGDGNGESSVETSSVVASDVFSTVPTVVHCSLYDSVSDLKRSLQSFHPPLLAIDGRKRDRDGLLIGWDVLHEGRAMGPHLFLEVRRERVLQKVPCVRSPTNSEQPFPCVSLHSPQDYGVEHGDVMHVVVDNGGGREEGEEREFRRRKRELKQRSRENR